MATARRPHGTLIKTPSDGVCFEHVQIEHRPSYWRSFCPHGVRWRCQCIAMVLLAFKPHSPRRSLFATRTLPWYDRGLRHAMRWDIAPDGGDNTKLSTVLLALVPHSPRRSPLAVRTLPWCDRGFKTCYEMGHE